MSDPEPVKKKEASKVVPLHRSSLVYYLSPAGPTKCPDPRAYKNLEGRLQKIEGRSKPAVGKLPSRPLLLLHVGVETLLKLRLVPAVALLQPAAALLGPLEVRLKGPVLFLVQQTPGVPNIPKACFGRGHAFGVLADRVSTRA